MSLSLHPPLVPHPWRLVWLLSVGQLVSWGTFYYGFSLFVEPMERELGWSRTDLTPSDVDVAEIYDGFTYLTFAWLEALGFCGDGEAGPFVEGAKRVNNIDIRRSPSSAAA